ncbi:MAG: patatin-like phospholipase family protein [Acidobacteriaceae bacterium]|nr:patatin-like phospholipase family protein [Acidobacteriaceae bacterium]
MQFDHKAVGIGEVVVEELADIARRRGDQPAQLDSKTWEDACHERRLTGLCLSGGGIRSATFGLGVLQALVKHQILQKTDYLSSVSGGGYIASWLQGVLLRYRGFDVLTRIVPGPSSSDPVTFLRKYSNYLAPRTGFSLDSIVIPIIWLRNTVLNHIIIYAVFAALFSLLIWPGYGLRVQAENGGGVGSWIEIVVAAIAGGFAVVEIGSNLKRTESRTFDADDTRAYKPGTGTENVALRVTAPLVAGVVLLMLSAVARQPSGLFLPCVAFAILGILHALLQWRGGFVTCYGRRHARSWLARLVYLQVLWMSLSCAGFVLLLFIGIQRLLLSWDPQETAGSQCVVAFGPPLYLLSIMAGVALQIGLMGIDFPDASREWLARAGALFVIVIGFWATLFAVAIFAPIGVAWVWHKSGSLLLSAAGTWISTTAATVLAGNSRRTADASQPAGKSKILEIIAKYGPFVAVPGFLVAVASLVQAALFLPSFLRGSPPQEFLTKYWERLEFIQPGSVGYAVAFTAAAIIVAAVFSLRVNINEFSLHYFYKNRLVRCYLGASHTELRKPDSFTGFDPLDDILLRDLRCDAPRISPGAPYPLLNACLNVTTGSELATQERKGLSFTFSPRFCGFVPFVSEADETAGANIRTNAFVDTAEFLAGIHLGTALSISGAALSPNRGFHSSPQTAFLLTLFNARLGWWAGNPRNPQTWMRPGPLFALRWLFLELFGAVDQRSAYLNLSDGGHFDNLGLYELVRRRCRYVIAVDAEEDPRYIFESLGEAVRKCRADFGVEIRIDIDRIRPVDGRSRTHYVVGRIEYPEPGSEPGWLLYLKSSITGDEPADVVEYFRENAAFPQQSTLNQFFSESEFESYRRLGLHVGLSAFQRLSGIVTDRWFERLAAEVKEC